MRVTGPGRFFVLSAECFGQLMRDWFPMPVHLLEGLFFGTKNTQLAVGQRERLLALGSLSAGLTHELNNPAAAAVRATAALRERVAGMRHKLGMIAAGTYDPAMLDTLIRLQENAVEHVAKAPKLGPIEASDAEDVISDWLQDRGISDGWELAPVFVQAGLDIDWLDRAAAAVGDQILDGAVRWLRSMRSPAEATPGQSICAAISARGHLEHGRQLRRGAGFGQVRQQLVLRPDQDPGGAGQLGLGRGVDPEVIRQRAVGHAEVVQQLVGAAGGHGVAGLVVLPGHERAVVICEHRPTLLPKALKTELADLTIYVIDVAAGDKIPRKGGPGITRSDLLVINKTDLAPLVGASLDIMDRDAKRMRGARPFVFTNLKAGNGVDEIVDFVIAKGGLSAA